MTKTNLALTLVLAVLGLSCDKNSLGTIDVKTDLPFLSGPSASPDSIYLDNLTPAGGLYSISSTVSIKMSFAGTGQVLTANVLQPTSSESVAQSVLHDDGVAPDQTPHDSVYSGTVQFNIQRAFAGRYKIQFIAQTPDGYISNIVEKSLRLTRRNSSPVITDATVPAFVDSVTSGYITVQFTASVSDSDGLSDVQQVFYTSSSDPTHTRFFLKDDGGVGRNTFAGFPDPLSTGDDAAGDGKFSILLPITPQNTRGTRLLLFQAIDSFGDTSTSVQRSFTIR